MKYAGMPMGMWVLFAPSFRRNLTHFFGLDEAAAKTATREAKEKYRKSSANCRNLKRLTDLK